MSQQFAKPPDAPWTFRVENIPCGTTADQLKGFFELDDQPRITVRSLVPAIDRSSCQTATILFLRPSDGSVSQPRVVDNTIHVDSDFHGFTPLFVPEGPIAADVIAITGLAGHAFGSWSHSPEKMWLLDYLPSDVPNVRVITYGYPSQLQGSMSRNILSDYSKNLTLGLSRLRKSIEDRPIAFIGHSLGCLIIKKVLIEVNNSRDGRFPRLPVRSIIFMGAPHRGLNTEALETLVRSKLPEDLVRELKAGSPTLVDLDDKFGRVATEVDILSCLESKQTKTAIEKPDGSWKREGPPVLMVPSHSAQLGFTKEITVSSSSDHSGIAKLKRTEGGIYFDVSCAIQAATLQRQKGHSEAVVTLREVSKDSEQPVEEEIQAVEDTSDSCGHSEGYRTAEAKDVTAKPPKTQGVEDEQIRPSTGPLRGEQPRASSAAPPESDRAVQDEINAQQLLKGGLSAKAKCLDETALYRALRGAAESGHDAVVRQLLEEGTGVNARDGLGRTLLHWAAESGRDAVTQLLLEKGSNVNARDDSRRTALHWAAKNGHEAVAQQLLEKGAGVDTRDESRRTALHLAAGNGHEAVVRLLMEKGANADARDIYGLPVQRLMALGKAARSGLTELVLLLLKIWTNLDTGNDDDPSEWGRTPLHWAAENGHEAVTWLLLERGSNVNARDNSRRTALHWAATNGHEAVVRQLLKKGADASATDRWRRPALHQAAMNGHEAVARALLEKGASIGGRGDDGLSAQRSVAPQEAFTNRLKVTPLKKTAGVNTRDRYRRTALHWAAMNERNAVVQLLLDSGAEVDAREDDGRTALHWAAKSGNEAVVQQLLRKEANVNARDNRRRTALHWAAGSGREAVTRLLLENGLNVNARDGLGQTALHRAAKKGREAVVLLLLENGAKTNAKDGQRRSARDWADREGHKAVVSLLTHST